MSDAQEKKPAPKKIIRKTTTEALSTEPTDNNTSVSEKQTPTEEMKPVDGEKRKRETNTEQTDEPSSKKSKNPVDEDTDESKKSNKKPQELRYVPWQYLTTKVLKECVTVVKPFTIPSKGTVICKILFDYVKFAAMCPDCPPIRINKKAKALYSNFPFLKAPFGYSPRPNDDGGGITNTMRYSLDDYINEESARFRGEMTIEEKEKGTEAYGLKAWDDAFVEIILENKKAWEKEIPVLLKLVPKNKEPTKEDALLRWKTIAREGKSGFPDYVQFKMPVEPQDAYTAKLNVWNTEGKRLASVLTQKNSTEYKGEDKEIIFDKNMYATGIICFEHINFTSDAMGITFTQHDIKIATREELMPENNEEEQEEDNCPI